MNHEDYLSNATPSQVAEYQRIKAIVHRLAPDIEETMGYGIPSFRYKNRYLIHFGIFKDHVSLFPGPRAIEAVKDQLKDYKLSKGTIAYSETKPVPEAVVEELVRFGIAAIDSKT